MSHLSRALFAAAIAAFILSCTTTTTDPGGGTEPVDSCGGSTATWDTIEVILDNECRFCHEPGTELGGISLDSYDSVVSLMESGLLLATVKREEGVSAMPPIRALDPCDVTVLEAWMKRGYPR